MITAYDVRLRLGLPLTAFHVGEDAALSELAAGAAAIANRVERENIGFLHALERNVVRVIAREPSCNR